MDALGAANGTLIKGLGCSCPAREPSAVRDCSMRKHLTGAETGSNADSSHWQPEAPPPSTVEIPVQPCFDPQQYSSNFSHLLLLLPLLLHLLFLLIVLLHLLHPLFQLLPLLLLRHRFLLCFVFFLLFFALFPLFHHLLLLFFALLPLLFHLLPYSSFSLSFSSSFAPSPFLPPPHPLPSFFPSSPFSDCKQTHKMVLKEQFIIAGIQVLINRTALNY